MDQPKDKKQSSKDKDSQSEISKENHALPMKRQELLKWNGWGYNDSKFEVHFNPKTSSHYISFTGNRYKIGGNLELPHFAEWVQETLGIDLTQPLLPRPPPTEEDLPPPVPNPALQEALARLGVPHSYEGEDRLFRSHGHTLGEVFPLRAPNAPLPRLPDVVVWPRNGGEVEAVVRAVGECGGALVVFGGGTSVTGALLLPQWETRTCVALDTSQMARILELNTVDYTVRVEAGITGQKLEEALEKYGYTVGHQPDSYEFSSVGGWVATRASGMKKNTYGNIEDLLVGVEMVSPVGRVGKLGGRAPRISAGPDLNHVVMGSEGTLGVVTEVTLKVRPLPPRRVHGSLVFPDLAAGVGWLRDVAAARCQPASLRLMDNSQFKFGRALRPPASLHGLLLEGIKKMYLTRLKGFCVDTMCVATLLFEGTAEDVATQQARVYGLAAPWGGIPAGETNGERGYMLTFVIAYIRDLGMDYGVVAESFETSAPWGCVEPLIRGVGERVALECNARGVVRRLLSARVTQTYDAGACIYFYFAFNYRGVDGDPVVVYQEIEDAARDEILQRGGSISHHHGVGQIRREFMPRALTPASLGVLGSLKRHLDPNGLLACNNLLPASAKL